MAAFETTKPRVLIIGAGPSGIGAARTLFQAGLDPIILEARDRIGGRMWQQTLSVNLLPKPDAEMLNNGTNSARIDSEVVIQLGANWIHGLNADFNPMFARAQVLNLGLHPTTSDDEPGDDVVLFDGGRDLHSCSESTGDWKSDMSFPQISGEEYQQVLHRYHWVREHLANFNTRNGGILTLSQAFEFCISSSCTELGPCSDLHRRCLNWIFDRISIEWAEGSIENIPAPVYTATGSDGAFGEALVAGGYFQVLEDLACEFPLTVLLGHVVKKVTTCDGDSTIVVECENGEVFVVDYCIVTLPVGVLNANQVEFVPSVPRSISAITSTVSAGLMNLVWMLFPAPFWPLNVNFFGVARDSSATCSFSTFLAPPMPDQHGVRQAVLMCQVVGDFAKEVEKLSNEEIAARAMVVLRSMFGENIPNMIGLRHSSWKSDPFAMGSWCHLTGNNEHEEVASVSDASTVSEDSSAASSRQWSAVSSGDEASSTDCRAEDADEGSSGHTSVNETPASYVQRSMQQCVYYAGEATHELYRGTVHGAFLSGIREADRVLDSAVHHFGFVSEAGLT